jgi:hypothetical protein
MFIFVKTNFKRNFFFTIDYLTSWPFPIKTYYEANNLLRIHYSDSCPLSSFSINFVAHDGTANVVSMNSERKWIKGENAVFHLTADIPEF